MTRVRTLALIFAVLATVAMTQGTQRNRWVSTWAASLQATAPRPAADSVDRVLTVTNTTMRQVVRVSIGGSRVRIRLSNQYGDRSLVIGSARVALHRSGATIEPATDRVVKFNGRTSVVIRAGANLVSDPIDLAVPQLSDLAISLFITDSARLSTRHSLGLQTNYLSRRGDSTAAATFAPDTTVRFWSFLAGVDVVNPAATGVIITLGNSITDGVRSMADSNGRWPDVLARRLLTSREPPKAVVNAGISGNRVLTSGTGPSALERFDRDVLMQPGVTHVIMLEGINDIGSVARLPNAPNRLTAVELIAGHQQLIDRAHERGLVIFGATLTPVGGLTGMTAEAFAIRDSVNTWIRTSGAYDGVIDFDKATRDPADTTRFLPAYDSGDHLHPSPAGLRAMGEAIDLALFRKTRR